MPKTVIMRYLMYVILALVLSLMLSIRSCSSVKCEKTRLDANQTALLTENLHYKTTQGKEAASVLALTLKCNEYERLMAKDAQTIKSLHLKAKNIESVSRTETSTDIKVTAPIIDMPISGGNSIGEQMRAFNWADAWASVKGVIYKDSVSCEVHSADTLIQVVHRVPRRFLFIKWGTKELRQEIVSSNPHTTITYTEFIKLSK